MNSIEEKRRHSSILIPYSYLKNTLPDDYPAATPHWHNEFEICEITEGACTFRCGSKVFTARKNDIVIVPPNAIHSIYPLDGEKLIHNVFIFHPGFLAGSCDDRIYHEVLQPIISGQSVIGVPVNDIDPYYDDIRTALDNIFSFARRNTAAHDLIIKSELMKIFWLLIEGGDIRCADREEIKLSESILTAIKFIGDNYNGDITVDILCEKVHLSKNYFISKFKKAVGMSPIDYVNRVRMKAVCEKLTSTSEKITNIAFSCEFKNISNFNRQFEKIAGCKPMEYRASKQGKTAGRK